MGIIVENLTKTYGTQRAVDNISFEVKTGEILGFLGPNGAGKTTTMKIITCFMAPTAGDVKIGEISIYDDQDAIKRKIGYLPESNPLYLDMPVLEYLEFAALIQKVPKEKVNERIAEMVHITGLNAEKHKKIGELSKGYRQRVGLAQALIHDPEILILDEPTTGLDPNQIVEIRNLIREIGREKTVILSTHILPEVEEIADRIIILNNGKIVADGTAESLRRHASGNEVLRVQILDADVNTSANALQNLESVKAVDFVPEAENTFIVTSEEGASSRRDIFNLCVSNKWFLSELAPIETKLEDVFRELTMN
jgi:ABC-2 type transport system ATP-binding protein